MVLFSLFLGVVLVILGRCFDALLLKPRRLRSRLERQGIQGPVPSLWYGNIPEMKRMVAVQASNNEFETSMVDGGIVHSCPQVVFPHLVYWRNEYGPVFVYSTGNIHFLCITDSNVVKEINLYTSFDLGKPTYLSTERGPLLGRGILSSNGSYWAHQRRIIALEFYPKKVKKLVSIMVESTLRMLNSWEDKSRVSKGRVEIMVDEDMRRVSADIISRACFGKSYLEGEQIFTKLQLLQKTMSKQSIGVPGLRYIPNKHNREVWRLESEIDSMILEVVKSHDGNNKKDLLSLLLDAAENYGHDESVPLDIAPNKFIIDNCKNIYFAGHDTTTISASWCLMVLAAYPEWQARVRAEVVEMCGNETPTHDKLRRMTTLTMVIQETLRLYPPVAYVVREALQDIHLQGIDVPKGTNVQVPIAIMHQLEDLWGPDANQFKPDRFANGTLKACKIPQAYMPFGLGSRTCTGQYFAMAELKVILSIVLSKFSLSLSSKYRHCPMFELLVRPKFGVYIIIEKLE